MITQILTGVQATSSVGSLVSEIGVPLTGLQSTSAVGGLSFVFSIEITLAGQQLISTVGADGVSILAYADVTATQSASYSDITATQSASYSDVNSI